MRKVSSYSVRFALSVVNSLLLFCQQLLDVHCIFDFNGKTGDFSQFMFFQLDCRMCFFYVPVDLFEEVSLYPVRSVSTSFIVIYYFLSLLPNKAPKCRFQKLLFSNLLRRFTCRIPLVIFFRLRFIRCLKRLIPFPQMWTPYHLIKPLPMLDKARVVQLSRRQHPQIVKLLINTPIHYLVTN